MRDIHTSYVGATLGDRSIRNIPVPSNHRRHSVPLDEETPPRRRRRRLWPLWIIGVVLLAGLGAFLLSTVFAGATIMVYPRTETVSVPESMTAMLNAPSGTLSYQSFTIMHAATTTAKATGTEQVSRQASGKITIYNEYSSSPQRLIANTRFQAPDGKIYRVKESVEVPGKSSVEAIVYADSPGAQYNRSESTRFTIPGFKDDPRYDTFYARSNGSISGGFVGEEPAVSATDLNEARTSLERALESSIREASITQVPDGYFIVPGTLTISFKDITKTPLSGGDVSLSLAAEGYGAVVRAQDLAGYTALAKVGDYRGEAVAFKNDADVTITAASSTKPDTINISLSGNPTLIWQYDPSALRDALLGQPKSIFEETVRSFEPAIARAEARMRPFWSGTFPTDPEKIMVKDGNR